MDDEFTTRVLDSMSFSTFVAERGPPYRVCDIFDEVSSTSKLFIQLYLLGTHSDNSHFCSLLVLLMVLHSC